jgi:putative membrane protein
MSMKRLLLLALLVTFACRSEEKVTSTDTISTSGTETTGTTSTTSTGSSGGTVSSLNAEEKAFFVSAVEANLAGIALGRMAADKATNAAVKKFAAQMVNDHGLANEELKRLALKKGVALPAVVNKEQAKSADELSKKVGRDFDASYMAEMIRGHETVVKSFESASTSTNDPDLKSWIVKTLPTLQNHLAIAKNVESGLSRPSP